VNSGITGGKEVFGGTDITVAVVEEFEGTFGRIGRGGAIDSALTRVDAAGRIQRAEQEQWRPISTSAGAGVVRARSKPEPIVLGFPTPPMYE